MLDISAGYIRGTYLFTLTSIIGNQLIYNIDYCFLRLYLSISMKGLLTIESKLSLRTATVHFTDLKPLHTDKKQHLAE